MNTTEALKLARQALEPFATAFNPKVQTSDDPKYQAFLDRNEVTPCVTMGDFRRAHEAISALSAASAEQPDYNRLRAAFHATMLRLMPEKTHAEISVEIDRAVGANAAQTEAAPQASQPVMKDMNDIIAWLDSLHETTESDAITNRKWVVAQQAIAAIKGEQASQPVSALTDEEAIDRAAHYLQEVIAQNGGNPSEMAVDHVLEIVRLSATSQPSAWDAAIEAAAKDIESRAHLSDHADYFAACVRALRQQAPAVQEVPKECPNCAGYGRRYESHGNGCGEYLACDLCAASYIRDAILDVCNGGDVDRAVKSANSKIVEHYSDFASHPAPAQTGEKK